jgi:hypothetical protein
VIGETLHGRRAGSLRQRQSVVTPLSALVLQGVGMVRV